MDEETIFGSYPGFCPDCGTVLPTLNASKHVQCYGCKRKFPPEIFAGSKLTYTIQFNTRDSKELNKTNKAEEESEDGPIVERKCPKCNNEKMSYATVQLRSADEGQTVFYTCTKCKYKESENS